MKNQKIFARIASLIIALICVLSAVTAFVSCSNDGEGKESESGAESAAKITITLEVVGPDGSSKEHVISTTSDKNLRQALEGEGLISGEEGAYGLYVKVVDGITADYDVDQSWWGLYKDGVKLNTGVDGVTISDGDHYELVYSK